jgi:hypothetical protein
VNRSFALRVLIAAGVLAALVGGMVFLQRASVKRQAREAATDEEKAYSSKLTVSDEKMSAAENFIGDTITYFDANLTNQGAKSVREVELRLEFVDMLGQVVLRESAHPVTSRTLPLDPGKTRSFQVSFDHMPADWNQAPPRVTVTHVRF